MRKNHLREKGLSLSQAQSISNLCNQRALEIESNISGINNASKTVKIENEPYTETVGKQMPGNIVALLMEKSGLHATQAFLMENIKAKDELLKATAKEVFNFDKPRPTMPVLEQAVVIPQVTEEWGWEQLSSSEVAEFLEAEAFAAHIGQFIHRGGTLDKLRKELPNIKTLEFIEIEKDKKTPMRVTIHHDPAKLLELHEELAKIHREKEQRVNYFKAKVKNLVTAENTRIAKTNTDEQNRVNKINEELSAEFEKVSREWRDEFYALQKEFEVARQEKIKFQSALRIEVDPRFQPVIDKFMSAVTVEEPVVNAE